MPVSYTKAQKAEAKEKGTHLVTIAAAGVEFSDPVTEAERDELLRYALAFLERRRAAAKAASAGQQQAASA